MPDYSASRLFEVSHDEGLRCGAITRLLRNSTLGPSSSLLQLAKVGSSLRSRTARQRCQYDGHRIEPPIPFGHVHYVHELFDIAIGFCNLGLRKPAGLAQCPQLSVRTGHGGIRTFKAVPEIADPQTQHRRNDRVDFTPIPFFPEFVAEAHLWCNGAKEGFAPSVNPPRSSASHQTHLLENSKMVVEGIRWPSQGLSELGNGNGPHPGEYIQDFLPRWGRQGPHLSLAANDVVVFQDAHG
jgi:hypothetical protein